MSSGLVTWSQHYSHKFVFLGFSFHLKIFVGDRMAQRDVMRPNAAHVEGMGLSMPQVGGGGHSPQAIFANITSESKFKGPRKKKGSSQKLRKKG